MKQWIFYGHLWIGLGAVALGCRAMRTACVVDPLLLLTLFLATVGVYTLHRLLSFHRAGLRPGTRRYALVGRYPGRSLLIGWGCLGAAAGLLLLLYRPYCWVFLLALPFTLFYLVPIQPGGRRLRDLPYLKVVWVALAWALVTAVFPGLASGGSREAVLWVSAGTFQFTLAVALLFDFRDVALDRRQGVRTVANTSPPFARALAALCFLGAGWCWGAWLPVLAGWAVSWLSREDSGEDWYAVVVNGLLVVGPLLHL